jgi:hypothetical protein
MNEKTYQLRFKRGRGWMSYAYVTALPSEAEEKACEVAKKWIEHERTLLRPRAPRVCTVIEYDTGRFRAVRHGERFKLQLRYIELRFRDGRRAREDWYEAEKGAGSAA